VWPTRPEDIDNSEEAWRGLDRLTCLKAITTFGCPLSHNLVDGLGESR